MFNIPTTVAEFSAMLREERGWTLEQLAVAIDAGKSYVWHIENDPDRSGMGFMRAVWQNLEMSAREIKNWEDIVLSYHKNVA